MRQKLSKIYGIDKTTELIRINRHVLYFCVLNQTFQLSLFVKHAMYIRHIHVAESKWKRELNIFITDWATMLHAEIIYEKNVSYVCTLTQHTRSIEKWRRKEKKSPSHDMHKIYNSTASSRRKKVTQKMQRR